MCKNTLESSRLLLAPLARCHNCGGLLTSHGGGSPEGLWTPLGEGRWHCPVCSIPYQGNDRFSSVGGYLRSLNLVVEPSADLVLRAHTLSEIGARLARGAVSPVRALFDSFAAAGDFVHVVGASLDDQLAGCLKLVSRRASVHCLLSAAEPSAVALRADLSGEAPRLRLHLHEDAAVSDPQGLVVVDGFLGLLGPPALGRNDWDGGPVEESAVRGVTDAAELQRLHHSLFCLPWATHSPHDGLINMGYPF